MRIVFKNNPLVVSIIFLITLIQTSCTSNFNPSTELDSIEKTIINGEADSISGHNEEADFKYWIKEGKIIKLSIIGGNFECMIKDEYFFKEDGVVFANKTSELCLPNAADYKALIIFDGAKILTEEYWLEDKKVSKLDIQKRLNELGYSIEENILKDKKTKKIKGLLNIKDFDERFNFNISEKEDEKSQITDTDADKVSKIVDEEKILFFEQQWGPYDNQKTSYKFTVKGTNVDILYNYADHPSPIEKAQLKDGKIITEYGYSDTYVINSNSLCVPNPETGESDCYPFIRSKSTHDIEETMNPEQPGYFKGQTLKTGEKIIKINWGKENKTNYTRDMSYSGYRYASKSLKVPNGKKWILIYINEDFTFESGHVVGSVPDLFIDNRTHEIGNRRFSNVNNINLSRAKDENIKIYSGSTVKAISSRTNGKGVGDNFIEYLGEMWFLEIND